VGRLTVRFGRPNSPSVFDRGGHLNPKTNQTIAFWPRPTSCELFTRDISLAKPNITGEVALVAPDGVMIASPGTIRDRAAGPGRVYSPQAFCRRKATRNARLNGCRWG